jgi:uncharacterized protein involved in exopolysaccharide biosynthesis
MDCPLAFDWSFVHAFRQAGAYQAMAGDPSPKETTVSIIDALQGQQAQLKRLLAQESLIAAATRPDLFEIESQVVELKRLLTELDRVIKGHLKRAE